MRAVYAGLGALALATVQAWEYPYCVRFDFIAEATHMA